MHTATAPQMLDHDWLTVAQTAAYLQCCPRTVHRYLDSGLLSAFQLVPGGTIRISANMATRKNARKEPVLNFTFRLPGSLDFGGAVRAKLRALLCLSGNPGRLPQSRFADCLYRIRQHRKADQEPSVTA